MTNQKRECGDCNMCCKLYSIHEPKDFKKDYEWCKHCKVGVGCKIYDSRPNQCKDFQCGWSLGLVPEEWKPNKVGFVVTVEKEQTTIVDGKGDAKDIEKRVEEIEHQIEKANTPYEVEQLQNRLAKVIGGVAIVYVGGSTEIEMKEKKL